MIDRDGDSARGRSSRRLDRADLVPQRQLPDGHPEHHETEGRPMTGSWSPRAGRPARAAFVGTAVLGLVVSALAVTPPAGATTTAPCSTADLSVQLEPGSPGAGQRYATVVLTNSSSRTCTIHGYGGLALLGAPGQGVPTDVRRVADPAPQTVSLARGASARSLLHWGVAPADDEPGTECEPTATAVVVTPPDQTSAALLPWTFGPVCQHGLIHQNAYVPGSDAF
jgi:hypothetical protein